MGVGSDGVNVSFVDDEGGGVVGSTICRLGVVGTLYVCGDDDAGGVNGAEAIAGVFSIGEADTN